MQYASKLQVNYNAEKVRYQREVELPDGLLTLKDIGKHLKDDEKFHFEHTEYCADDEVKLIIVGYRLETDEEVKARVAKAEKYNENYEKFHAKYRR